MKIVKHKPEFHPVTITLETQNEVNWMYELFGSVAGNGIVRQFTDSIYYGLEELADDSDAAKVFFNTVEIK